MKLQAIDYDFVGYFFRSEAVSFKDYMSRGLIKGLAGSVSGSKMLIG